MVARDKGDVTHRETGFVATAHRFMETWRLLLGSTGESAARATRRTAGSARGTAAVTRSVLRTGTESTSEVRAVVMTGVMAVLVGGALSLALAAWQGAILVAIGDLILVTAWLCVRLVVMLVLDSERTDDSRSAIVASWATGLLPFAVAVLPALRVAAWALSLWLIHRTLRLSATRDKASAMIRKVVAFEVGAIVLIWLTRNLSVAALLLGS